MNCKKCGFPLKSDDKFCKKCGAPVNAQEMGDENNMNNNINNGMNNNMNNNMNNGMNNNVPTNVPQKNNKMLIIGIIVAIVAIAAVIIVIVLVNNNKAETPTTPTTPTPISNNTTKVVFNHFEFSIPNTIMYSTEQTGVLLLGNSDQTWVASIAIEEGSFSKIIEKKSQLKGVLESSGYTATDAAEKSLGGVKYVTLEVSKSGTSGVVGLAEASSQYFITAIGYTTDNKIDYGILTTIAPIISSAKYSESSNSIKTSTDFDLSSINSLSK